MDAASGDGSYRLHLTPMEEEATDSEGERPLVDVDIDLLDEVDATEHR